MPSHFPECGPYDPILALNRDYLTPHSTLFFRLPRVKIIPRAITQPPRRFGLSGLDWGLPAPSPRLLRRAPLHVSSESTDKSHTHIPDRCAGTLALQPEACAT